MDTPTDSEAESLDEEGERLRKALSDSEDEALLTKKRIKRFSHYILNQEAWFYTADKLIEAMKLLQPHIESYWEASNAQWVGQGSGPESEHSLTDVYMMLAGFAIENLCKGYLVPSLTRDERNGIKGGGSFPDSLKTHNTLELIERTGMTPSEAEKDLVDQIYQANWRGRYPSPTSHEGIRPFVQSGSDIHWITTLVERLRAHARRSQSET